ncbi:MAG: DUF4328 domain-containing protein [Bacteroidales bacterium]|jgi:hypothetical protein|nr:DUF4328 domain-containing protein [Bacteroidales bacterium]
MELKNNTQRAKNAIIFIWIAMAVEIVSLISSYLQYGLLQIIANGGDVSDEIANANDAREQIIGIISFIAFVISLITFIMWFRRAYYNLHQKVNSLSFSEGWAAGSWFVPIINLYRPYQIMKELYMETKRLFQREGLPEPIHYTTAYIGWWWALWIITSFIGTIIFRSASGNDTVDGMITLTTYQMALCILNIPLAFIMVKVIKDYAKVEPLLFQITDSEEVGVESESNESLKMNSDE